MSDDTERQLEVASLLSERYYLILNNNDSDSFSMTAYDTTTPTDSEIPAGMVVLSGIIELMENNFDAIWDAGVARTNFISMVEGMQIDFDDDEVSETTEKVLSRTDNIIKVDFGNEK